MAYSSQAKATLILGLPLVGSHLAQIALHVTDTVMMGWYGVVPLAAVVLGTSFFFIIWVLGAGFSKAVMPMVAGALARGDETQVRRDTRMGLWLSILYGVATYPLFYWSGNLLSFLGQQPDVVEIAAEFLQIAGLGMVPALCVAVLQSYLAALGRTQAVLWVTLAAVGLNAMLAYALIFGHWGAPELGATGAAISSVTVQTASYLLLWAYAAWLPALRKFHLFQNFWRPDWAAFGQVQRLGWPIGLTSLAEGGLFAASALMMGWVGTHELAAHGIALEAASIAFMIHMGLSSAGTIRVARFHGTGEAQELRRAALVAILLSTAVAVLVVTLFLSVPGLIIGIFLDETKAGSAEIMRFGVQLLAFAALFQLADAMQVIALGVLRGLQDTRVPMVLAALSYWVIGIPISYVLAFQMGMGGAGLWLGLVIGLTVAAGSLLARFWLLAPKG
ncbi:MATE family efflux transporter [Xinfangfangia sp. CPCC 101601]|uniref:Multidrug-efflux transporter n=2 Tax=Pseudogemmobacter lacusdianii TaxID=3069608 RepID=A0ABU0VTC3_9RHOB|nr:MATE family efflux transporter [Xinfangfangia sp. CPCC 101601]MDQ2064971.1 MATE family efflux transporter [Xinfangfangia sp. CPCC 101601]